MKRVYILDAGHAGAPLGYYQTPGKRSPDGKHFEGVGNRRVVDALRRELYNNGHKVVDLLGKSPIDVPIKWRINWVKGFCKHAQGLGFEPVLISIHSNAAGNGWSDARGVATWCHPSEKSKHLAEMLQAAMVHNLPDMPDRGVRTTRWGHRIAMVDKTPCTAVLLELGFHTNRKDLAIMHQKGYARKAAVGLRLALEGWEIVQDMV